MNDKGYFNGAVYADLDNDGDLDLVTNNINDRASVFQNNSDIFNKNNYLRFKLNGRYSANAKIILYSQQNIQSSEYTAAHGFQSSQEEALHFGIGKNTVVDSVKIIWLNGKTQLLKDLTANQVINLTYSDSNTLPGGAEIMQQANATMFNNITKETNIDFVHIENEFEDFDYEPLLPHRYSKNGPGIAVADVDQNGYEDFWIGGPAHIAGKLFLQQKNGKFISRDMPDKGYEDMSGIFFDADGDDDMDLYVVSGGNEYRVDFRAYQDRLYLNDGLGNFRISSDAVPAETTSGSCVATCDFDKDGDIDLFVGGRIKPGSYPYPAESFILQNNGQGRFENVTRLLCPELFLPGLVTSALWSDFDNDGWQDLIIAGEWMPVSFYRNNKNKFQKVEANSEIDKSTGWWLSIAGGDFDNDGDQDYVAGNLGQNNFYNASQSYPLSVYAKDFDGNGKTEALLSYFLNGTEYPIGGRDEVASVLPLIKKKFDTYSKYAIQPFSGIFPQDQIKDALVLKANNLSSCYFENKGKGVFSVRSLPLPAQFSAIQCFTISDFDKDGHLDILLAGNFYSPTFMTGRYDASIGLVLKGDGKGYFKAVDQTESGVHFAGDVRSTVKLKLGKRQTLIVAANSGRIELFELQPK